jgi:ABC-type glycerol-3-phosphate transport system substrate-binding protein
MTGLAGAGLLAAACAVQQPAAPQVIKETVVVEVEKIVKETVVVEKVVEGAPPDMEAQLVWDTFRGPGTGWNEERISTFRDNFPNVTIEFRPLTGASQQDNYAKMYALHAAGDLGDVIAFDPSHFHFWRAINKEIIGPLDDLVAGDQLDLSQWFDTFMSLQHFQGKLYGLPSWGWAGFDSLVTNALHFEEAGVALPDPVAHDTSMETIAEWARQFRDEEKGRYGLSISHNEAGMVVLCRAFGGDLINADGTKCLLLEDENAQKALKWAYALAVDEKVLPTANDLSGGFPAAQLEGKVTMNWSGSLDVRNFKRDIKDAAVAKASQILFPTLEDGRFPSQIRGGTWNILKGTEYPEAAYEFIKHIAGKEGTFGFNLVAGQGALVRPDVIELLIAKDPVHEWFIPNLENGIPAHAPANSRGREYTDAVQQWTDLLLDPNQPVAFEQGLKDLNDNIQKVLDEPPA